MKDVKGYTKLTNEQKELFDKVFQRHLSMMGTDERAKYQASQLKEIKWDQREKCLKVYWKGETDWFHYDTKGNWY